VQRGRQDGQPPLRTTDLDPKSGTRRGDRTTVDGFLTKVLNVYYKCVCIVCVCVCVCVCVDVCVCMYVKSLLRDSRLPRRVSVSLSPRALVLRPARRTQNARLRGALYHEIDHDRMTARSVGHETHLAISLEETTREMVVLSTSSRSRHSLSIL